ncbi:N-acyl homoserine lactonase family protein [Halomonas sp. QX-2]|jgi:glyoxylase-like metal-dependent hydrolase (beta-lactamase superfamily II)|uniref:N-acyl homoserine lactonase family protein n=1 Tax=Vreelandella sedimenti TaxID=2729618 RepID=A0A7Z0SQI8_9GAMM|nr:N-acyl homoserine lactonase family protein [Halomonas sedimenti]NYT74976.1 N-acyl homoserine lactonase family protein [Halomonas sedimenti]|tara:strand:- start:2104 stop:2991 length:888 start_codon:yes stop_codon:yes gene_type:complete
MANYSIHVLEYSYVANYHKSGVLYGAHNEGYVKLPYCYVLIRSNDHIALVDVGYNHKDYGQHLAEKFGVENWRSPKVVLSELGLTPEDVDTVFITHAHFDHFGSVEDFPNATFYIQREEIEKWVWALSLPDRLRWLLIAVDPSDILRGVNLAAQGRLRTVEGSVEDVLPGIDLHLAKDSHTFGSMWVTVRNDGKPDSEDTWVLAGDLVYQFSNIKNDGSVVGVDTMYTPVGLAIGSQMNLLLATEEMMKQVDYDDTRVIPIHEEGLADRFPSRITKENLRISEICLADNMASVVS